MRSLGRTLPTTYYNYIWRERPVSNVSVGDYADVRPSGFTDATADPSACWRALMDAVDNWPLAKLIIKQLGGKPKQITASGVICGRYPPLAGFMLH